MILADKILNLRTGLGLSQGELAEKLEVSRQSVSKWETGQSVPDLDKIIKLADLFGVAVDDLVREDAQPELGSPQTPEPPAQPQGVYAADKSPAGGLNALQTLGVIMEAIGAGLALMGIMGAPLLVYAGVALVILGLPLLLAKRHPLLICGWLLVAGSWAVLNPWTSVTPFGLLGGLRRLVSYLTVPAVSSPAQLFGICVALGRGALTLLLLVLTWRAWRRRKRDG